MKKIIITCLLIATMHISCLGENIFLRHLNFIKDHTSIPYKSWTDKAPMPRATFRVDALTETSFENFVWIDLALTQKETIKIDLSKGSIWAIESMIRKFQTDTEYILFSARFGQFDFVKEILVTIDKNGNYIDSIAVGAAISGNIDYCYPMKWEITEDMTVKTYQLKPTSSTPILYTSDTPDSIHAERIDRTYKIDSNGKFTEVEKKFYNPKNYTKEKFLDKSYDISTGNEIYIKPIKIEKAPLDFDN